MTQCLWTYGQCTAAVHARGVAVVAPGHDDIARRLWELFDEDASFTDLVQVLTADFGTNVSLVPNFAVMVWEDDGVRVAVRGDFTMQARQGEVLSTVDGGALMTWTEQRFPSLDAWSITHSSAGEGTVAADGVVRDAVLKVCALVAGEVTPPSDLSDESDDSEGHPCGCLNEDTADIVDGDAAAPALPPELMRASRHQRGGADSETTRDDTPEQEIGEPEKGVAANSQSQGSEPEPAALSDEDTSNDGVEEDSIPENAAEEASVEGGEEGLVEEKPAAPAVEAPEDTIVDAELYAEARAEEMLHSSAASAEEPQEAPAQPAQKESSGSAQFHDGYTVNLSAGGHPSKATVHIISPDAQEEVAEEGPKVLAVPCLDGHANPPYLQSCRICGREMSRTLIHVERPSLGRLIMSTGEIIELDRDVVFGRNPKDLHRTGRSDVRVVAVESAEQDISRTHCEIRVDGWDARVRDLGSQNGTFLTHVGQSAKRIDQARPEILRCGDVITLAQSISIRLEC